MLGVRQRHRVFTYLLNAAARLHCREDSARDLVTWVREHARLLEFDAGHQVPPTSRRGFRRTVWADSDLTPAAWVAVREALQNGADATRRARPDLMLRRLRRLADVAGLTRTDVRILEVLLLYETDPLIESMVDDIFRSAPHGKRINATNPVLSVLLDLSLRAVSARFGPDAPLVRSGLVEVDYDGDLSLVQRLQRLAFVPGSGTDVKDLLLKTPDHPELDWSDFEHVAEDRDHVARLLEGALRTGEPGVNILLYGPPGTGKTQFCRTVAERLGVPLFSVGEEDDDRAEPTRRERIGDLRLAHALLRSEGNSLVLFDEMVDVLPQSGWPPFFMLPHRMRMSGGGGSKLFVNRLLETAPVPTLWTANTSDSIPGVLVRRMKFTLELRLPAPRVRARMWCRQLARNGIEADPDETLSLATSFAAPPGVAAEVTAAARLAGGDLESVRRGLRALARALGCEKPHRTPSGSFDLSLLRSDMDLVTFAERLVERAERQFSICLQGPPGTGKSACVRYPRRPARPGGAAQAGVGSPVALGGRDRAEHRGGFSRGPRRQGVPRLRRGRFAAGRPASCGAELGGQPDQRDAYLDGEPPPAVRLHHQLRGSPRSGDATPVRV